MLRLGELAYLNTLPLTWQSESIASVPIAKTILAPTGLNRGILAGELDVSAVSSAFYLRHQHDLVLLDSVCIGANGPVDSVLLILPHGWDTLVPGIVIAVPDASETSIALMRYLVYQRTGWLPETLSVYAPGQADAALAQGQPTLTIGDDALRLQVRANSHGIPFLDLGAAWKAATGLPFVFAVWVARRDWANDHLEVLAAVNIEFGRLLDAFQTQPHHQAMIFAEAHHRAPQFSEAMLTRYLTASLCYDFRAPQQEALACFATVLHWLDTAAPDDRHVDGPGPGLPLQLLHRPGR